MDKRKKSERISEDVGKLDIRTVTDAEWDEFEDYYIDAVQAIEVPADLDANDILYINSEIDEVYTRARFDYGYAKKMCKRYATRLSNAKKQLKLTFKKKQGQTADERDALILEFLDTGVLKGDKEPLMKLAERWEERAEFMDSVIDNLLKKSDKMVNGNGALKLDAQGRGDVGRGKGRKRV